MDQPPSPGPRAVEGLRPVLVIATLAVIATGLWWTGRRGPAPARGRPVPASAAAGALPSPYENTHPGVAYLGDEACARCHAEIAASYRRHPMGRSLRRADEGVPEADGVVFEVGDLAYAIRRRDGRVFHQETRRDGSGRVVASAEAAVRYVLGSGTRGLAFLVEKDGDLYQSPIAWYAQGRRWDLAPGYREQNQHFGRRITLDCLFCHTNRVEMADGRPPEFRGLAIGCERCHGPGELHARRPLPVAGKDPTIVNPATLEPAALRDAVCEQCHLLGTGRVDRPGRSPFDYRPGLPLHDFVTVSALAPDPIGRRRALGHADQLRASRCATRSGGRLGCISCHDPHRLPEAAEAAAYYRDRCLACHADRGCGLPRAERRARGPEDDCIACHMPRAAASDIAHTALTQHTIAIPPFAAGGRPRDAAR